MENRHLWKEYLEWLAHKYGPGASAAFSATHLAEVLGITRGAVTYHMERGRGTIEDRVSEAGHSYRVYTDGLFRGWQFSDGGKMWTANPETFFRTVQEYWSRDRRMTDVSAGPLHQWIFHGVDVECQ